jgi:hypothetical protein
MRKQNCRLFSAARVVAGLIETALATSRRARWANRASRTPPERLPVLRVINKFKHYIQYTATIEFRVRDFRILAACRFVKGSTI